MCLTLHNATAVLDHHDGTSPTAGYTETRHHIGVPGLPHNRVGVGAGPERLGDRVAGGTEQYLDRERYLFVTASGPYRSLPPDLAFRLVERAEWAIAAENSSTLATMALSPDNAVVRTDSEHGP